jgi:hypothetical protein
MAPTLGLAETFDRNAIVFLAVNCAVGLGCLMDMIQRGSVATALVIVPRRQPLTIPQPPTLCLAT